MTIFILGMTWGGREYSWNSVQVITTMVIGVVVSIGFVLWQWKGPKYPLVPRKCLTFVCQFSPHELLTCLSPYFQVQDRQRRMPNNGHQRMELCHASVLCPVLLPARLWILCHKVRSSSSSHHHHSNHQQHSFRLDCTLDRQVPGMYFIWLGMLGRWPWSHVDFGRNHRTW